MLDWIVQHLIANIPVALWAVIVGAGIGGYVISGFADRITVISGYAKLLRLVSIAVFSVAVFMMGGTGVAALWQKQIDAKQAEVVAAQQAAIKANTKIKYIVVQKIKVIHDRQVVVKHDIQRDAAVIDKECKLAPQAIKDLNEATE
jgi:hypothetical protein